MRVFKGDRVTILQGDEKGSWGIVRLVAYGSYHVAIADGNLVCEYDRNEIRKSRSV